MIPAIRPPATARLRLRRLTAADLDALCELDCDEGVLKFVANRPPTRDEQWERLEEWLADYDRWPDHGHFAAHRPDGEFIGWFELQVHGDPSRPELGYRLHRRHWGLGLATEGAKALLQHAFSRLGASRVWAQTMAVNHASRRVLAKCGLIHTDTLHLPYDEPLPGAEHGEVFYRITRREWARSHGHPLPRGYPPWLPHPRDA